MLYAGHRASWFSKLLRRGVFHSPSRVRVLTMLFVLSLFIVPRAVSQVSEGKQPITHGAVPQARVDPRPVRLPVIDGKDIRFTRLSTENGLSQTRVSLIVQDDQGFMWFGTQYG